jgi:hypothetical protein
LAAFFAAGFAAAFTALAIVAPFRS